MSDRVIASDEACVSIQRMQSILNGPLLAQIDALSREGQALSNPNAWDGRLAQEFRARRPQTHQNLLRLKESLEGLRQRTRRINQDSMQAGGNA